MSRNYLPVNRGLSFQSGRSPDEPARDRLRAPRQVPDEVWREYLMPIGESIERARLFERMLTALDPAELEAVAGLLRHLDVPVLLVWGTAEEALGMEWAYRLRDLIPSAREVVEIDGGTLFFPEERPEKLAAELRRHWGR